MLKNEKLAFEGNKSKVVRRTVLTYKSGSHFKILRNAALDRSATVTGVIDSRVLNLGTRWRWVGSFKPRSLSTYGKDSTVPLGGSLCRSGHHWVKQNLLPLLESNPDSSAVRLILRRCTDRTMKVKCDLKYFGNVVTFTLQNIRTLIIPLSCCELRSVCVWCWSPVLTQ
jgi:hypothetical protein